MAMHCRRPPLARGGGTRLLFDVATVACRATSGRGDIRERSALVAGARAPAFQNRSRSECGKCGEIEQHGKTSSVVTAELWPLHQACVGLRQRGQPLAEARMVSGLFA